jgi:hypothetical protein
MGVYFSLSRIKKDDSYIKDKNEAFVQVDFDIKENFFVEYIDTLMPTANGIGHLLERQDTLGKFSLSADNFLFFTKAGSFLDGQNVEIFFDPNAIVRTIRILIDNKTSLVNDKIFDQSALDNLETCKNFLEKAIAENNYVQFYWQ